LTVNDFTVNDPIDFNGEK